MAQYLMNWGFSGKIKAQLVVGVLRTGTHVPDNLQ